jgi:hypothetical protein
LAVKHEFEKGPFMQALELEYLQSATHIHGLLHSHGYKPAVSRSVLDAAVRLLQPAPRVHLVREAKQFCRTQAVIVPNGLEETPSVWLRDFPVLISNSRKPRGTEVAFRIRRLIHEAGVLCVAFAQEWPNVKDRLTSLDRLRIQLTLSLQPNRWTPLSSNLERRIWVSRPEIRAALFRLHP